MLNAGMTGDGAGKLLLFFEEHLSSLWNKKKKNKKKNESLAVFILEAVSSVWTNLGKHLMFAWLFEIKIKTGTRCIIRLDELFSVVRCSRRTMKDSSSRRIMRLVAVFILETHKQTNKECLSKFVQTDYASYSIKTAIDLPASRAFNTY